MATIHLTCSNQDDLLSIKTFRIALLHQSSKAIPSSLCFGPSGFLLRWIQGGIQRWCSQRSSDGRIPLQESKQCLQDLESVSHCEEAVKRVHCGRLGCLEPGTGRTRFKSPPLLWTSPFHFPAHPYWRSLFSTLVSPQMAAGSSRNCHLITCTGVNLMG